MWNEGWEWGAHAALIRSEKNSAGHIPASLNRVTCQVGIPVPPSAVGITWDWIWRCFVNWEITQTLGVYRNPTNTWCSSESYEYDCILTNPTLTFADTSEKEDKTQLEPTFGESRGLGDGFPRTQAPDCFHQVWALGKGDRPTAGRAAELWQWWDQDESTSLVCKWREI